jgi:hypothetical protein
VVVITEKTNETSSGPVPEVSIRIDMKDACVVPPKTGLESSKAPIAGHAITPANACSYFLLHSADPKHIKARWDLVLQTVRTRVRDDLAQIDGKDLAFIFEVFDQTYFAGTLWQEVCKNGGTLSFQLSNRKSKKAGHLKHVRGRDVYEIALFLPIFTKLFTSAATTVSYTSNGVNCHSRLECLLNVFAHELTHLLISRFCYDSVKQKEGQHGKTFKKFVLQLFGQTQTKHALGDEYAKYY